MELFQRFISLNARLYALLHRVPFFYIEEVVPEVREARAIFKERMSLRDALLPALSPLFSQSKATLDEKYPFNPLYDLTYLSINELIKRAEQSALLSPKSPLAQDVAHEGAESWYAYYCALVTPQAFAIIVGRAVAQYHGHTILNVGSGSGELERMLIENNVPAHSITSVDPSEASVARLSAMGVNGIVFELSQATIAPDSQDLTLLSYFLDYDLTQQHTLHTAMSVTKKGGTIVIEILLPVLLKVPRTPLTVTRGYSSAGDIVRIVTSLSKSGTELHKRVTLTQITFGLRQVYASQGLRTYPSYFLTLRVED